jgi:hypothetical protein
MVRKAFDLVLQTRREKARSPADQDRLCDWEGFKVA